MTEETKDLAENTSAVPQTEAAQQQETAELNIADLNALKTIIDVASSRGAFKPSEMTIIGQNYTKLSNFLDTVAKQQPKGA